MKHSLFKKALALTLCFLMLSGILTACMPTVEFNPPMNTPTQGGTATKPSVTEPIPTKPNGTTAPEGTTGNTSSDDPVEDEVDPNELYSASTDLASSSLIYGSLANDVVISADENVVALVPANVKIEAGASSLALSIKNVEGESLEGSLSNLDVHISGIAADNTVPMTVLLGAILPIGLANTELKLYHVENGTPVLMTRVNSVDEFAIHNQYVYDAETGNVTIFVASFSVFTAVQTSASKWDENTVADTSWYNENDTEFTLEDVADFLGFRDLVDAGKTFEGKTVILATDIDLSNKPFDPIGYGYADNGGQAFMGTFDGGNHTIYNLYENCWELDPDKYTYSTAGAGLFASIKNATIKNLAISGAEIVFECVDMGIVVGYAQGTCHFENIIVTDSKIANYNRYTGGLVGEVSYGPYGIDTSLGYSHTFKNITIDSSVTVSGLWGSFGCGMGGVIGGKWGDATVKMENVVSAPTMDVYNDVVSAYQWYAFRGCGMLIGHTEEPYSDGRHSGNATASFLTCENVNVYYGDWVDYNYYEFANQDSATGRSYPWVRAEEGNYCDAFSNIRYGVPTHGGVKVSDLTEEELKAVATDYTTITFNQLYGADRGMYGTNKHEGVNVSYSSPKTFYIENNLGWENLTLHYVYEIGEETWTTVPDGVELVEFNGVYRIDLPVGAKSFTITADGGFEVEFTVAELTEKETYLLHIHNFAEGSCSCGASQITNEYEFTLGENGSSGHKDTTTAQTTYTETNSKYTLSITNGVKVYPSSQDEQGNSCFKLGSGEAIGSFEFMVPENVNSVIIAVAGYKAKTVTIEVNGTTHAITTLSDNGAYTTITVDTSTNKTVEFKTTSIGYRCMINTITFVATEISCVECVMETVDHKDASCGVAGYTLERCSVCGKETRTEHEALEHDYTGANPYICVNNCGVHDLPAAGSTITIQQALWIAETLANDKETTNKYVITGVIDDKDHPSDTGATTITTDGYSIYITNIHNVDGSIRHDAFAVKLRDGDTITVSAKIAKNDSGEAQLKETRIAQHTDLDPVDHTCDICGAREITTHIDENSDNLCDICGNPIEGGSTEPTPDPETPTEEGWIKTELADIKETDIVVIVWTKGNTSWALTSANGSSSAPAAVVVTVNGTQLTGEIVDVLKWNISNDNGNLTIYPNGTTATWLYCTSTNNGVRVGTNANKVFTIDSTSGYLKNTATSRYVGVYTTNPDVRCYTSTTTNIANQTLAFYVYNEGTSGGTTEPTCEHNNTTTTTVEATCTVAGSTTVTCDDCGATVSTTELPIIDHNYVDGTCTGCGEGESSSALSNAILDFSNSNNRELWSTSQQVWKANGITLTNDKGSSTSNIADYVGPARFYKSSKITIEAAGIKKIVFTCNSSSYATALKTSIDTDNNYSVTVSGSDVTITFTTAVDSFVISNLSGGQVRMSSLVINP